MKKFNKDKELLSAYIDGELSQKEKQYLEDKIKSSLELQKELLDLKKLKELTQNSGEQLSDSPYFETRLMTAINSNSSVKYRFKKWIPALSLSILTIGLMVILKLNPNLINNLIEEQKSNIAGFYKENLQPLLYAANLTNEDIFNFAMNQQLPLDENNKQILQLGYDPQGKEFFEIKKVKELNQQNSGDNLKNFIAALNLNQKETEQIDSIIGSYSEQLSSLVLVNDKNSVAINPVIWNTRKAILADILSFAKEHAADNFYKIIPTDVAVNFDPSSVSKWVSQSKSAKDNQYIFFTPDSIFKENFVFDMADFQKNMKNMEKELKNLDVQTNKLKTFTFNISSDVHDKHASSNKYQHFQIAADSNFVKVTVKDFNIPDIGDLQMPDFDSIAIIINEATKNIGNVVSSMPPQMHFNGRSFDVNVNSGKSKKKKRTEVNLDSLMNLRNFLTDSIRSEQLKKLEGMQNNYNYYLTDSLIIKQNEELQKEMDNLKKELKRFREEMKNYNNKNNDEEDNNFQEIKYNGTVKKIFPI